MLDEVGGGFRHTSRATARTETAATALWLAAIAALHEGRAEDARVRLERLRGLGPLDGAESRMFDPLMNEATARHRDP